MPMRNPVVVAGFFRSGTSLLYALLNGHPRIALMYECNVWEVPRVFSRARFRREWLERQEFFNQALSRHRLTLGSSTAGLENIQTPEQLYQTYAQTRSAEIWGEKSPLYGPRLRRLADQYPAAVFIVLWRNPSEIYRSVLTAGTGDRFFQRAMLSRLIYAHEEMLRQATELQRTGRKVRHVDYLQLVDQPEAVCRDLCRFLDVEFDPNMLDLNRADLSALDPAGHHDHLRRRKIVRQELVGPPLPSRVAAKLDRFRARWRRLRGVPLTSASSAPLPEPGLPEQVYHRLVGRWLFFLDVTKRVAFEFLPLAWLRGYRQTKKWFLARRDEPVAGRSLGEQLRHHWPTLLVCALLLFLAVEIDRITGPWVTLAPLYAIPVVAVALLIDRTWATWTAIICALAWSFAKMPVVFGPWGILAWNCLMRFLLLQLIVLQTDRIRIEAAYDTQNS